MYVDHVSVFGSLPANYTPSRPDCSDALAVVQAGTLDPFRTRVDPTGYVPKVLARMPQPNNYDVGDGLNTAGYRWLRREDNGTENIFGFNGNLARQQINTRVDHNFNARNKLGVSYTYEDSHGNADYSAWPDGFQGRVYRHPQTLAANFISTLSPVLVNEARVGMRRNGFEHVQRREQPGNRERRAGIASELQRISRHAGFVRRRRQRKHLPWRRRHKLLFGHDRSVDLRRGVTQLPALPDAMSSDGFSRSARA